MSQHQIEKSLAAAAEARAVREDIDKLRLIREICLKNFGNARPPRPDEAEIRALAVQVEQEMLEEAATLMARIHSGPVSPLNENSEGHENDRR